MEQARKPELDDVLETVAGESTGFRSIGPRARAALVIGLLGILIGGSWFLFFPGQASVEYKTEPLVRHDLTVTITATGQLAPVNEVEVGSELSGTIANVAVDYNDKVTAGQVLATLDTAELEASVVQQRAALQVAEARVDQAQATLNEAQLKYQRSSNLVERKLASEEDLDVNRASLRRAEADLSGARAQVDQARATLDAVQTKLSKTVIRAPINGIVLSRNVEPGQTVAAAFNTPVLFALAEDLRHMELHVDVDEADVGNLREGQSAQFTVDAYPGRVFAANVTQVRFAPRTVEGVVTYETLLSVDNEDQSLRPGMTATAEIRVATVQNALLVPNAALRFVPRTDTQEDRPSGNLFTRLMPRHAPGQRQVTQRSAQATVWVLDAGTPRALPIQTGLSDGSYTVVTGGELSEDTRVITGTV